VAYQAFATAWIVADPELHRKRPMNDAPGPPLFIVGLLLVVFASYFASWTLETNGVTSLAPTIIFVPGFLLVLVGQAWFLGAFAEQPEGGIAALVMIALFGLTPGFVTLSQTWGTGYRFIKWVGLVDLAVVLGVLLLVLLGPLFSLLIPKKWKDAREARAREEIEDRKRKLPG
jgi:hypothetical protein